MFRVGKDNPLLPDYVWGDPRDSDVVSLMVEVAERAGLSQYMELHVATELTARQQRVAKSKTTQASQNGL
jgi:hypothetical protein